MLDTQLEFAHTKVAEQALKTEARQLIEERGVSENDAMVIAAATMDGAGEGETVESMQTCRNLFGEPVKGLTTDDIPERRQDEYAATEAERHASAEENKDLGALWLTLSNISSEGMSVANEIMELVTEDEKQLDRFWSDIRLCVDRNFSDDEIVQTLSKILAKAPLAIATF